MIFFVPFFYVGDGPAPATLATPVMLALVFSLFEALLLLPSHLGSPATSQLKQRFWLAPSSALSRGLAGLEQRRIKIADWLPRFAGRHYRRLLLCTMAQQRAVLVAFFFLFLSAVATVRGGWLPFSFFPRVTSDFINAEVVLPEAAPFAQVVAAMRQLESSAEALRTEVNHQYGYSLIRGVHATAYGSTARVALLLEDGNDRPISSGYLARQWQRKNGAMQGLNSLNFGFTIIDIPKSLEFVLRSDSQSQLEEFSAAMLQSLQSVEGLHNIGSTLESPANEIDLQLRPEAENLSLSLHDISLQLRQAFYGEEAQRIPRQREDVKVLVRYAERERGRLESLEEMRVMTASGARVPLSSLVDTRYIRGYKKIERLNGERVARVSADLYSGYSAAEIIAQLESQQLSWLQRDFPAVTVALEGEQRENDDFLREIFLLAGVSLLAIFALMAVMFRSYWQPLLVLTAVPFGFMGAILGHVVIGVHISMFSILGMMACAGVVVNDNVVLIDRINQLRRAGRATRSAVVEAAVQRFRPIVLTSVTTFLGLTPILLESSVQAQFLIPMVTSLSFGVLCATFVTLLFVPLLYLTGERLRHALARPQEGGIA